MNSVQKIRHRINADIFALPADVETIADSKDMRVSHPGHAIPIRLYTPPGKAPFPLLVFIHGAGWVAGSLDTHDNICRCLASRVGCIVLSVGYRLAPENKFPTAVEESYHALLWAVENAHTIDATPYNPAIAGDSAGGNLAAAVCLLARDRQGPSLGFQLLVNPALDFSAYDGAEFEQLGWFRDQYLRDANDRTNPYASPLLAPDLTRLPRAFIITGERDPLQAEGEAYARRLHDAGVSANVYRQAGMGHLAGHFARAADTAQEAVDLSVATLKAAFAAPVGPGV